MGHRRCISQAVNDGSFLTGRLDHTVELVLGLAAIYTLFGHPSRLHRVSRDPAYHQSRRRVHNDQRSGLITAFAGEHVANDRRTFFRRLCLQMVDIAGLQAKVFGCYYEVACFAADSLANDRLAGYGDLVKPVAAVNDLCFFRLEQ